MTWSVLVTFYGCDKTPQQGNSQMGEFILGIGFQSSQEDVTITVGSKPQARWQE